MDETNAGDLLNYRQAARYLSMPLGSLYHRVSRRQIPHLRLSARSVRFRKSELDLWLEQRRVDVEESS